MLTGASTTPLAEPLADAHRRRLDDLLKRRDNGKTTWLAWLRQSPTKPNSRHMLEHIERLKAWQALDLPTGIERLVHQNRLLKIAREGVSDDTRRPGQIRAATALRHSRGATTEGIPPSPTKSSTCTTASWVSCLTLPRISISSSSRRQARPSTPRYVCTGASVRR